MKNCPPLHESFYHPLPSIFTTHLAKKNFFARSRPTLFVSVVKMSNSAVSFFLPIPVLTLECPSEFHDTEFRRNFAEFFPRFCRKKVTEFRILRNSVFLRNPNLFDRQLTLLCQPNDMTPVTVNTPIPQINTSIFTEFRGIRNSVFLRNSLFLRNSAFLQNSAFLRNSVS